jgi:hypothetical protein
MRMAVPSQPSISKTAYSLRDPVSEKQTNKQTNKKNIHTQRAFGVTQM